MEEKKKEEGESEIQEHGPEHWFSKWERQCLAEAEREEPSEEEAEGSQQQKLWHLFQNSATAVAQLYKGPPSTVDHYTKKFLSNQKTSKAVELLEFMNDVPTMSRVAFLCDITGHLNSLNLQLQGRASSVGDLFEKVCAFQRNLEIFNTELTGKMLNFPTLHVVATDDTSMKMMQEFMNNLIKNFQMRFENFKIPKDVLLFVRDPFVVSADGPCPSEAKNILHSIDEGAFQLEIVRLQSSDVLKAKFQRSGTL
ncbi:UNVERIFIED_CONTAM: hypothetical protein FKN15_063662 [Acipenser sinensis]